MGAKSMTTNTRKQLAPITPERVRALQAATKEYYGWSAADLAERLGVGRSQLKRIESGTRGLSFDVAQRIRKAENDLAYCVREAGQLEWQTLKWIVAAVEQHAGEFTKEDQKRIEKALRKEP